jgi:hypothetical protein
MSSDAITARLELMAALSRAAPPRPAVDMSPEAITRRLESMSALSTLCRELAAAGQASGLGRGRDRGEKAGPRSR